MPQLSGSCHCGQVHVAIRTKVEPEAIVLRECQCGFCRRHGAKTFADPAGEFRVAFGKRRGPLFLGRQLLRDVGACLEIDWAETPPFGVRVRGRQHHEGARRTEKQRGYARSNHLRLSPARFHQHNCRGLLPFWGRLQPRNRTIFRSGSGVFS